MSYLCSLVPRLWHGYPHKAHLLCTIVAARVKDGINQSILVDEVVCSGYVLNCVTHVDLALPMFT